MGYQLQILRLSHTSDTHSLTVTLSEVEVFPEFLKKLKLYVTSVSLSVLEVFNNFVKILTPNFTSVTLSVVEVCTYFLKILKPNGTSVTLSVVEVFSINHVFDSNSITSKNRFHFNPNGK